MYFCDMKDLFRSTLFPALLILAGSALLPACKDENWPDPVVYSRDFEGDMKELVSQISGLARGQTPGFLIVPNNGERLLTDGGRPQDFPDLDYIDTLDGIGGDELYYGYFGLDQPTPYFINGNILGFLEKIRIYKKPIFITDYCYSPEKVDDAYTSNKNEGFLSYAAPSMELDQLASYPAQPFDVNVEEIDDIGQVKNFLNIQDLHAWQDKQAFISDIAATNYDLVITDLYFHQVAFSPAEVEQMKQKQSGQRRLVLAALHISEADSSRYYWDPAWTTQPPAWMLEENASRPGNYHVNYWDPAWQAILLEQPGGYIQRVIDAGFDGVYLNGAGAYQYFEDLESQTR